MKKIAIIIGDITRLAGTERAVCNLSNLLSESRKYDVLIISAYSFAGQNLAYNVNSNVSVLHLGLPLIKNKIVKFKLYCTLLKKINKICIENNVNVILGTAHAFNVLLFFLKNGIKLVACEHYGFMEPRLYLRMIKRIVYPYLDAVVVLTKTDIKNYLFRKNVRAIPNSLSFLADKQATLNNKVILAVGSLIERKGFDLLIDAISLIKDICFGWEVKIIGSGEVEDKLKKQILSMKLTDIVKIYPPTNEILQEYLNASIFVLSSRQEGFGLVIIEAQSCGLPVISFDCPKGPKEIINHNEDGMLVKAENTSELSKAILELIKNQEKRIELGKNALQNSKKYLPENIFILWDTLLSEM